MDLHPIFVHFPVALITLFAVLEVLPLERKFGMPYFFAKFAFLFFGLLMSIPAYITGGVAGEILERGALHDVVELHGFFAGATIFVAVLLLIVYLVRFGLLYKETILGGFVSRYVPQRALQFLSPLAGRFFSVFLALILLVLITITGALGGSMVYGPGVDPIATLLYSLFGLN